MVIPHPEDAPNYRMTPAATAIYRQMGPGAQGRFRITMQAPPLSMNITIPPLPQLPETTEDGRPLYSFKLSDIRVIFSREDGLPLVHDLYREPSDSPYPD